MGNLVNRLKKNKWKLKRNYAEMKLFVLLRRFRLDPDFDERRIPRPRPPPHR